MPDDRALALARIARWRSDPVLFAREAMGMQPTPHQQILLRAIAAPGARVTVASGHGTGKTAALAVAIWWHVCLQPDSTVVATAPTARQLSDVLWSELGRWRERAIECIREDMILQATTATLRGAERTQVAHAATARRENPEALQGYHARNLMVVVDEASGVDEKIFEAGEGTLSTPGARIVMAANPTRTTGYFFNSHHRDRDRWTTLRFDAAASPLMDPAQVESIRARYGEDSDFYRVRVAGLFPRASAMQLIPQDLVEAAFARTLNDGQYTFAPVILGVDVARYGDDRSVIYWRQGLAARMLWAGRGVDNMTLAGLVAKFEDQLRADAVFIDAGAGSGVIDRLRQLGRSPIEVHFGGKSTRDECINLRTCMWVQLKEWLESGAAVERNDELRDDLCGPEYGWNAAGKLCLEHKEDLKRRGLASPDLADALAVTFAAPVAVRDRSPGGAWRERETHTAVSEYDVFAGSGRR